MRKKTEGVSDRLLESALEEFKTYGFHDASIRRIAAASEVSTNSIYNRFGGKEQLFDALVKDAADGLMELYLSAISKAADGESVNEAMEAGEDGTQEVIDYIYDHIEAFRLIFCHSAGTAYADYFDKLAETEEFYYRGFVQEYVSEDSGIDDFVIHVVCRAGWQYVYEVVSHDLSREEAKKAMKIISRYNQGGWNAIIGEL